MTSAAERMAAGLAPARAARPIRAGERIHVVGAAGAGASAAAILAARAGAIVTAATRRTVAVHAGARGARHPRSRPEHAAAHVTTSPHPDRLAVTKALTAIDPDHPELGGCAGRRDPGRAVAAGRRRRGGRADAGRCRGHPRQEHDRRLARPRPGRGRARPERVRRRPAPGRRDRRRRLPPLAGGAGTAFVVEADEYAGNFDAYRPDVAVLTSAEWDHPDVFRRRGGRRGDVRALGRGGAPDGRRRSSRTSAIRASRAVVAASPDWSGRSSAYALVDDAPRARSRTPRREHRRAVRDRRGTGDAAPRAGNAPRTAPATTLEILGLDPRRPAPVTTRLATAGRHNAANALAVAGAAPTSSACRAPTIAARARVVPRASAAASSERARRAASSCTTTTATTRPRSARRSRPSASASPGGASGPSTSR